jgi:hypothetical protein
MLHYGGEKRCTWGTARKPEGKNHFEDLSVEGRIMLKCTFKKWDGA